MEKFLIDQINNSIRGIKLGTKKPQDVAKRCNGFLERLKKLNVGMYEELNEKYITQCRVYNDKKEKTY